MLSIRTATVDDAAVLRAIYAPYVRDTAITFEYEVPSLEEFSKRILTTLETYPYLVAEYDGTVAGYAYAGVFKARAAYQWSVETTVYVDSRFHGKGIGTALYEELESILKRQNIRNLFACISCSNPMSIVFHEKHGFHSVGRFCQCGYKFGQWHDMQWLQKTVASDVAVKPIIPFSLLG